MNKILIIVGIFVLLAIGFFIGNSINFTGNAVNDKSYTWTRAICNSENECIDVVITCENGNVVDLRPISRFVQIGGNWTDVREDSTYCE